MHDIHLNLALWYHFCLEKRSLDQNSLKRDPVTYCNFANNSTLRSSTCPLTGFFWLLSHMIYLKLTRVLKVCLLSQSQLRTELSAKSISQSSQIYLSPEKVRKCLLFNLPIKINQNINFAKLPRAKYFFLV